jgi:adenylosuccinate synthase
MINIADIIVDLQAGDTGKGKVAHALAKTNKYTHIVRYNGGGNAGHTVYHNGEKVVTHFVPIGVLYNIPSIIGPGCVVDPVKLEFELDELTKVNPRVREFIFIDRSVHVITQEHKDLDGKDSKIGTTKTGNGPAYVAKYNRSGLRYENYVEESNPTNNYICDIYSIFFSKDEVNILFEGAQGFELDIDWGEYPFVTSSHCTAGSACLNGVSPKYIRDIYGVSKAYVTYVGAKDFEGGLDVFKEIREIGNEYGATTGRPRQVNWLNLDKLIKASNINGVTKLIINKIDVLEKVNQYCLTYLNKEIKFQTKVEFKNFIIQKLTESCPLLQETIFSDTPYEI